MAKSKLTTNEELYRAFALRENSSTGKHQFELIGGSFGITYEKANQLAKTTSEIHHIPTIVMGAFDIYEPTTPLSKHTNLVE